MSARNDLRFPCEYNAWKNMKRRCDNSQHPSYKYYGERGISYQPSWASFDGFFTDMGECPAGLTLERQDNNQGYSKENCYWATWSDQASNRGMRTDNKSGVMGVSFDNTFLVWMAHVRKDGRRHQLYRGPDFFEAVCARKSWDANS